MPFLINLNQIDIVFINVTISTLLLLILINQLFYYQKIIFL